MYGVKLGELEVAADKSRQVRGQLCGRGGGPRRGSRRRGDGGGRRQHVLLDASELRPRFQAQVMFQGVPRALVGVEGVGLSAGSGKRGYQ